jgi:hypothetical protein
MKALVICVLQHMAGRVCGGYLTSVYERRWGLTSREVPA